MRLSKFLSMIGLVTLFSLLYVYQQTEILRLAYLGQKKVSYLEDLLDKNNILRYNINKRASLVHLGNRLGQRADFQMPETYRLVRLTSVKGNLEVAARESKRESVISRLFGIKRQAEAKTINSR